MTETEKQRLDNVTETINGFVKELDVDQLLGDVPQEQRDELMAKFVGVPLAAIDALFAIRDGGSWRNLEQPPEIARQILRDYGLGE